MLEARSQVDLRVEGLVPVSCLKEAKKTGIFLDVRVQTHSTLLSDANHLPSKGRLVYLVELPDLKV